MFSTLNKFNRSKFCTNNFNSNKLCINKLNGNKNFDSNTKSIAYKKSFLTNHIGVQIYPELIFGKNILFSRNIRRLSTNNNGIDGINQLNNSSHNSPDHREKQEKNPNNWWQYPLVIILFIGL